jgi:uncharacterized protein (DUF433 family)
MPGDPGHSHSWFAGEWLDLDKWTRRISLLNMNIAGLERITIDPAVMGGKPCLRGMRVTVGLITGLVASGASFEEILQLYPYLEEDDIKAALTYAAWRAEEREVALQPA